MLPLAGCNTIISSASARLADSITAGILNQEDPQTVADGVPAYMVLIDGMIQGNPKDIGLLHAGAQLYGAYAGVFVEDPVRRKLMTAKALDYASRALCQSRSTSCGLRTLKYQEFVQALEHVRASEVVFLYSFASAWAGWIQARSDDWGAIADLPKVKAALARVVKLDDSYDNGGAHLYLGVMASLVPPAMGGKPKVARHHFERAIKLSDGKNLMVKVMYAEHFARMMFDRKLHDQLLQEVLAADHQVPQLVLSNVIAKRRAKQLLASAHKFF